MGLGQQACRGSLHYTGYMLSVDTFYVCTLKGIGRIYQFTAVDTYSSFGLAYLYTDKSLKFSLDFIKKTVDRFKDMGITVERMLTDNGKGIHHSLGGWIPPL